MPDLISALKTLGDAELRAFASGLGERETRALYEEIFDWRNTARDNQLEPPGKWFYWLIQAGRGWGKTATALQFVRARIDSGQWRTVNVIGPTWTDVMDTMVNGSADAVGLMGIWPPHKQPQIRMSRDNPHMICWNGAKIRLRAAKEAERVRGPQADGGWAEEVDAWQPNRMTPREAFTLYEMGIRIGGDPRIVVTSTPKRGGIISMLRDRAKEDPDLVHITRGRMQDNLENLSPVFVSLMTRLYKDTRLGRQELEGELLEDVAGAIITFEDIEDSRRGQPPLDAFDRINVAVDPSGGSDEEAELELGAEKGVVVGGRIDNKAYLMADLSTRKGPGGWGRLVVETYYGWQADMVVVEKNYGGDMARHVISTAAGKLGVECPPIKMVTATRGKVVRAQPLAALYSQKRVHHCQVFPELEDQLTQFTDEKYVGEGSPDRADAWVWSAWDLILENDGPIVWGSGSGSNRVGREEKRAA